MRNRVSEKFDKVDMLIKISSEFVEHAVKAKTNEEFELYLKCSELMNNYAAELLREVEHENKH